MLPDVQNLIELQQADREIQRLKEEIAALPKRVAVIEAKLAGTKAVLENAKATVKTDDAARRKHEQAIQDEQEKISKFRDQSLAVKTNEQYKALLHEIQFAEQDIRAHEDKILELMVNAETREKEVKAAESELKEETAEIEKEKAEARQRTAEDEKLLAEWSTKRNQARAAVDETLLRQYDRVAKYRGSGLSEVRDHKCLACQVMLRPQTYNEVRSGTIIVVCDSCQRVLYYDPTNDVPVAESTPTPHKRRPHPKFEASQAWYYRPAYGELGEVLLVFLKAGEDSQRRIYDAHTGRQMGDILVHQGEHRLAFPEDLTEDAIRLNGNWPESELEGWGNEIPMVVLNILHRDLDLARAEMAKRASGGAGRSDPSQTDQGLLEGLDLWKRITTHLDRFLPKWRERIDQLGNVRAVEDRLNGRRWSDSEIFEGVVRAVLSNSTDWSKVESVLDDLADLFSNFDIGQCARLREQDISEKFVPWFTARTAGSMQLASGLTHLIATAEKLSGYSKQCGTLEDFLARLLKENRGDPKLLARALAEGEYKLPGLGVPLASEFLRNIGHDLAKPDRHINRAVGCFGMVEFPRWDRSDRNSPQLSSSDLVRVMDTLEDFSRQVGQRVAFVDGAIWLLCAKSGLQMSNSDLIALGKPGAVASAASSPHAQNDPVPTEHTTAS